MVGRYHMIAEPRRDQDAFLLSREIGYFPRSATERRNSTPANPGMTTEIRQIAFQQAEVCAALQDYRRRRNEPLPAGSISQVAFGDGPDVVVTLTIENDSTGAKHEVAFDTDIVGAALILFCINRKIPLPATAQKKVQRVGDSIGLVMRQDSKR